MPRLQLFALPLLIFGFARPAASNEPPFVAGFDRFHQDASANSDTTLGQLLIAELSCAACHSTSHAALQPKRGPHLDSAALRLQSDWVRRFLTDPAKTKPGTTMPHVLGHLSEDARAQAVDNLVAYLETQTKPLPEFTSTGSKPIAQEFWRKGDIDRGQKLYHQVGCVACHEPDDQYATASQPPSALQQTLDQLEPDEIEELGLTNLAHPVASVPHPQLHAKYTRRSLTTFLLTPASVRPAGRMPDLRLAPHEAADITAWIFRDQSNETILAPDSNSDAVAAGRRLFVELRCASCHQTTDSKPTNTDTAQPAQPLEQLDLPAPRNCLSNSSHPDSNLPNFHLNTSQRAALHSTLTTLKKNPPTASLDFQLIQHNCYACHERDNRGGVGPNRRAYFEVQHHVDLGDEGRIPPPLTGVGRKLTQSAFKEIFAGKGDVRPHMFARMPIFPAHATNALSQQFATADDHRPHSADDVFNESTSLADAGRQLLNAGCIQCHPIRGERLPGVVGIDLATTTDRVNPQWLRDFLLNPAELKSRTRMPTFFPDGKTPNTELLDGDVDRQLAAIYAYLADLPDQSLPARILQERVHNFELVPDERPIILRTFMQAAGTHAIAVGYPEKVHFAFDARTVRLSQLWRGRFLDAHATWFDRFIPPAAPLGTDVLTFTATPPFALLETPTTPWPTENGPNQLRFQGYRLNKAGAPTFLYRFHHFTIEDQLTPAPDQSFHRQIHVTTNDTSHAGTAAFTLLAGAKLTQQSPSAYTNQHGLTVTLINNPAAKPRFHRTNTTTSANTENLRWIIPLPTDSNQLLQLKYHW